MMGLWGQGLDAEVSYRREQISGQKLGRIERVGRERSERRRTKDTSRSQKPTTR